MASTPTSAIITLNIYFLHFFCLVRFLVVDLKFCFFSIKTAHSCLVLAINALLQTLHFVSGAVILVLFLVLVLVPFWLLKMVVLVKNIYQFFILNVSISHFFVVFCLVLLEAIPDHGYHTGGETIYIRGGIFVMIFRCFWFFATQPFSNGQRNLLLLHY